MRRSLGTVLDLRISLSSQRDKSDLEDCAGSTGLIVKSVLESVGDWCQVAARAMDRDGKR